jgi:mannose-6-phosphate isomerase
MEMYVLDNTIKHYAWGAPDWLPELTGQPNPNGEPWAELWMGVHNEGPSRAAGATLGALIAGNPAAYLGAETAREFGNLPFLLKFLAAAAPLSIQAHPNLAQAREGFQRENAAGIALNAPERNYKDPNHKPEIISALTPFTALAGFREIGETKTLLEAFFAAHSPAPETAPVCNTLRNTLLDALDGGYKAFLAALLSLDAARRAALTEIAAAGGNGGDESALCARFAASYPADPAVIAPLYLNLIALQPGEAIAIPAGMLHAYVYGFGVECMANSDNVLRGGLTSKYIDRDELLRILNAAPYRPEIITGIPVSNESGWKRYTTPFREFTLFRLDTNGKGGASTLQDPGAAIIAVTRGEAVLSVGDAELAVKKGESVFVPWRKNGEVLSARGDCTAFAALAPA